MVAAAGMSGRRELLVWALLCAVLVGAYLLGLTAS
jgi:hypothetical protein